MTRKSNPRERLFATFTRGGHRFDVYRTQSGRRVSYLGMHNGRLSVVAKEHHIATQMLLRRHATR